MTSTQIIGSAIAWALICLFWLGVNVFDGWVQRNIYPRLRARFPRTARAMDRFGLLGKQVDGGRATEPAKQLGGARRIGEK